MEKNKKLKNYSDKNYAELVSFPVELVGRDGVVRRYSYEDSIRIYRRRIDSAHLRFQDKDVIRAEVTHCTRRMEQIERSWRQRIRQGEQHYIEGRPDPAERQPYEQGKAFLQAYMGGLMSEVGRAVEPQPNLVLLSEEQACRLFYVNHSDFRAGTLLYVYDLLAEGEDGGGRAQFERQRALLRASDPGPDVEKLIHEELEGRYAFLVTNPHAEILDHAPASRAREASTDAPRIAVSDRGTFMLWLDELLHDADLPADGALREVVDLMGTGDLEAAFDRSRELCDENGWNRRIYWIMGALSEILGRWAEAAAYMELACRHFPADPQVRLLTGLHALRLGEPQEALSHLRAARELNPDLPCLYGLLVRAYAVSGDMGAARRALADGRERQAEDAELQVLATQFAQLDRWHKGSLAAALGVTLLAMAVTLSYPSTAWWMMGAVVASLVGLFWWYRTRTRVWLETAD